MTRPDPTPTTYTLIRDAGSFRVRWTYTIEAYRERDARNTATRIALEENEKILLFGPDDKFIASFQPRVEIVVKEG